MRTIYPVASVQSRLKEEPSRLERPTVLTEGLKPAAPNADSKPTSTASLFASNPFLAADKKTLTSRGSSTKNSKFFKEYTGSKISWKSSTPPVYHFPSMNGVNPVLIEQKEVNESPKDKTIPETLENHLKESVVLERSFIRSASRNSEETIIASEAITAEDNHDNKKMEGVPEFFEITTDIVQNRVTEQSSLPGDSVPLPVTAISTTSPQSIAVEEVQLEEIPVKFEEALLYPDQEDTNLVVVPDHEPELHKALKEEEFGITVRECESRIGNEFQIKLSIFEDQVDADEQIVEAYGMSQSKPASIIEEPEFQEAILDVLPISPEPFKELLAESDQKLNIEIPPAKAFGFELNFLDNPLTQTEFEFSAIPPIFTDDKLSQDLEIELGKEHIQQPIEESPENNTDVPLDLFTPDQNAMSCDFEPLNELQFQLNYLTELKMDEPPCKKSNDMESLQVKLDFSKDLPLFKDQDASFAVSNAFDNNSKSDQFSLVENATLFERERTYFEDVPAVDVTQPMSIFGDAEEFMNDHSFMSLDINIDASIDLEESLSVGTPSHGFQPSYSLFKPLNTMPDFVIGSSKYEKISAIDKYGDEHRRQMGSSSGDRKMSKTDSGAHLAERQAIVNSSAIDNTVTESIISDELRDAISPVLDTSVALKRKSVQFGKAWKGELEIKSSPTRFELRDQSNAQPDSSVNSSQGIFLLRIKRIYNLKTTTSSSELKLDILVKHGKGEYLCHPVVLEPGVGASDIDFECLLPYNPSFPVIVEVYIKKRSTSSIFSSMSASSKSGSVCLFGSLSRKKRNGLSALSASPLSSKWFSRVKSAMNLSSYADSGENLRTARSQNNPSLLNITEDSSYPVSSAFGTQCFVYVAEAGALTTLGSLKPMELTERNFELYEPQSLTNHSANAAPGVNGHRLLGMKHPHGDSTPLGVMPCQFIYIPYPSNSARSSRSMASLPTTISECVEAIEKKLWNKSCWMEGNLYQLGGDLNDWQKKYYRLIGKKLIRSETSGGESSRTLIDLTLLESVHFATNPQPDASVLTKRSISGVSISGIPLHALGVAPHFKLVFKDGRCLLFRTNMTESNDELYMRTWLESFDLVLDEMDGNHVPEWLENSCI